MSFSSDRALLVNQLPLSIDFPREQDKFLEILTELYKRIANAVNTKEGALYIPIELFNFQQFSAPNPQQPLRNVYRKMFDLVVLNGGPIPAGETVIFPHNITGIKYATLIYASCTSTGVNPEFFTVVYPNATMDTTNLTFINPLGGVTLQACFFIAEYLKN